MTRRRVWASLLAAGWLATVGCEREVQSPGTEAGTLNVWLSTPEWHDQAVRIAFEGPTAGFLPAPGFRAFPDPAGSGAVLVIADTPVPPGETLVGTVSVPDAGAADAVSAAVHEVARSDFILRDSLSGYSVRLAR